MSGRVRRIFVERRREFALGALRLCRDLQENLGVTGLEAVRIVYRYDFSGVAEEEYARARDLIFAEPLTNLVYEEELPLEEGEQVFAVELLPVQFDQQADLTAQSLQAFTGRERPPVRTARVFVLQGQLTPAEVEHIKAYLLNAVDSREASLAKPPHLQTEIVEPAAVPVFEGFNARGGKALRELQAELGLAMDEEDLIFCQAYFRDTEKREPTLTELRLIDTYWSDHCRHTTFQTVIEDVAIAPGRFTRPIEEAYKEYLLSRETVYGEQATEEKEEICLMDVALLAMKELRKKGRLPDLDESEEINACSIVVPAEINGRREEWLVMFKNETHNHPTEIEPFGGAATCLGGAIRDPLSGRAYVYQALRVTGSADPRVQFADTLPGKLSSSRITKEAAAGYSSYGNQIGVPAGYVTEFYAPGFRAKRMEVGAVIAAAPKKNVVRHKPVPGDVVLLIGGRTGRDGLGGATGSSQEHTATSLLTSGAEVQKGNAPVERRIQRLFRRPEASTLIKKCNDFGAGGVSVAIGELTDGLEIDLDAVPLKYAGLDGTEIALSESQERMAVVVSAKNAEPFCRLAHTENLEATAVAKVTGSRRLQMHWRGQTVVNLSRDFLDSSGVHKKIKVVVTAPAEEKNYFRRLPADTARKLPDLHRAWLANLADLNVCSQQGLVEMFDSTAGGGTVLMPLGGRYQATPAEGMAALLPLQQGQTTTTTLMTCGYDPHLAAWSPFHGACYAVVEAAVRIAALGGDYRRIRLTLQEYFEKLGDDPARWGKPFSALLGAFYAQKKLGIPAIGGKDSMSGTFMELHVPPTLIAFAVGITDARQVISAEFKKAGSKVILLPLTRDDSELPDFAVLEKNLSSLTALQESGRLLAAATVKTGGLAAALSKMAFGNRLGLRLETVEEAGDLFRPDYGSLILEIEAATALKTALQGLPYRLLGVTQEKPVIAINNLEIDLEEAFASWQQPLSKIFPAAPAEESAAEKPPLITDRHAGRGRALKPRRKTARPRVLIPVFPGTNGEDDAARAFTQAGALVDTLIFNNLTPATLEQSKVEMALRLKAAQILMLPGGFSDGGEPDTAAKLMVAFLSDPRLQEAVLKLLEKQDGLILGVCNGFQALVKLGLLPAGKFSAPGEPHRVTLTKNHSGRYISRLVQVKVVSTLSPWFSNVKAGALHTVPISHGEGRFVAGEKTLAELIAAGQVATQYADFAGHPSQEYSFNANGSQAAVEGITSPDGRILGRMAHPERMGPHVALNIPGDKKPRLFAAGVDYFS